MLLLCNSVPGHLGYVTNMSKPPSLNSPESCFNMHILLFKLFSKNPIRRPTNNSVEDCAIVVFRQGFAEENRTLEFKTRAPRVCSGKLCQIQGRHLDFPDRCMRNVRRTKGKTKLRSLVAVYPQPNGSETVPARRKH